MKILIIQLLLLSSCTIAFANDVLSFQPVEAGDGPALVFYHRDRNPSREVLYLYEPGQHEAPQVLWRGSHRRPFPLARINSSWMILEYLNQSYALNLSSGKAELLLPEAKRTEVLAVEGEKVFFVKQKDEKGSSGYKLKTDENKKTVVVAYPQRRDFLYVKSIGEPATANLFYPKAIEEIVLIDEEGFWVITDGLDRKFGIISREGKFQSIMPIDSNWIAASTQIKFSPNADSCALTYADRREDFHETRSMVLVDVAKKSFIHQEKEVPLGWGKYGGFPNLPVRWLDENKVICGEKIFDMTSKKFTDKPIPGLSLPSHDGRVSKGHFEREHALLFYRGDKEPFGTSQNDEGTQTKDYAISKHGKFAAWVSTKDNNIYMADGLKREKSLLMKAWGYNLQWLPSTEESYKKPGGFSHERQ